jgi:hypothetical protein
MAIRYYLAKVLATVGITDRRKQNQINLGLTCWNLVTGVTGAQPPYPVPHRFHRHDSRLRLLDRRKRRLRKNSFPASGRCGRWHDLRLLHVLHDHASVDLHIYYRGFSFHTPSEGRGSHAALLEGRKLVQPVSTSMVDTARKYVREADIEQIREPDRHTEHRVEVSCALSEVGSWK